MSLFSILTTNGFTLTNFQRAIDLTNKNVNNLDNEDYSRERPVFNDFSRYGMRMSQAQRIFDQRYFDRYIHEKQQMHYYEEASSSLDTIQEIFNETQGSGFGDDLNAYFTALNDIVAQPENIAARTHFLEKAKLLTTKFHNAYENLQNKKENLRIAITQEVKVVNKLTKSLAKLNKEISITADAPFISDQEKRNTLLNQRDKLIKQISEHIDTKVRYNANGTVDLFSAKGHALVVFDKNFTLSTDTQTNTLAGGLTTYSITLKLGGTDLTDDFSKGKLSAKLFTQKTIDSTIDKLNNLVANFITENNNAHTAGYDLDGNAGGNLFSGSNVADISVAISDPRKIAASSQKNETSNNENAKNMLALQNKAIANLNNLTFHDYYANMIVDLGSQKNSMDNLYADSKTLVNALQDKLQSIRGVNLDEELMRLSQLQRSYQASARVLNITDKLLETVMNIVH